MSSTENPDRFSRHALAWGAGPALACGFWIYFAAPRLFDLTLGWAGLRTLLLAALCSLIQFAGAAIPQPRLRIGWGLSGWLAAGAALIALVIHRY